MLLVWKEAKKLYHLAILKCQKVPEKRKFNILYCFVLLSL